MPSNNSRNSNETGKVNTHIPPVSVLSSTSEARTWIRSVSYPEKNGNSSVHWDNEFEPLIQTRQVPLDLCVFIVELSVPFLCVLFGVSFDFVSTFSFCLASVIIPIVIYTICSIFHVRIAIIFQH